jgi:apolipoprotein N-acyltransferase
MAAASIEKPQLYVLPETAFPTPNFVYETDLHKTLREMADSLHADIFFGADNGEGYSKYRERLRTGFVRPGVNVVPTSYSLPILTMRYENKTTVPEEEEPSMAVFNSAWQVKPGTGLEHRVYNKVQLVPFGESAPIVGMIPYFQEKIMMVGSFQKGLEYTTFETGDVRYGAMICFESAFGQLSRGLALSGAQMICVLTNDAWYDPKYLLDKGGVWARIFSIPLLKQLAASGPEQHFAHSIYRAIETRLPLVRAANTGISAFIEPSGQVRRKTEFDKQATLTEDVAAPEHNMTFYVRYGDAFAQLSLIVLLAMIGWNFVEWKKARIRART